MALSTSDSVDAPVLPVRWSVPALMLLLLISLPIVVCMPITSDTVLYDLQARNVLGGGVMYRDILEPNLPGAVWIHLLIRSIVGWSSELMRCFDLLIVSAACLLLAMIPRKQKFPDLKAGSSQCRPCRLDPKTTVTLLTMATFYLSRSEWCHCQRDSWMLLPVAVAATLRIRSYLPSASAKRTHDRLQAIAEGLCWGIAFWIKPHVAITAITVFGIDLWLQWDRRSELQRLRWVILGGILAAVPGVSWLLQSGAWPHFWEMQLNWNPEYVAAARSRRSWQRVGAMLVHFHPWWIVHILAIGQSIHMMKRAWTARSGPVPVEYRLSRHHFENSPQTATLMAAIYLSWLAQAVLLQHSMDYIQVPPVILAIAVVSMGEWRLPLQVRRTAVTAFAGLTLIVSPQLQPPKIANWVSCFRSGSSPQLRETLACVPLPDWQHFVPVVEFLQSQHVQAGDVTCYNVHCIHFYTALQIPPSSRYVGISSLLELFPSRRAEIERTVQNCGHRFIVADVLETEPIRDRFPWNLPIVFQSGPFRVYSAQQQTSSTDAWRLLTCEGVPYWTEK
ncbi:MAG: hypothetical protein KDB01_00520 [Planctomycetaceae bacterium]|nr:hypothetical protein [Planctomycetaceae bacterium]